MKAYAKTKPPVRKQSLREQVYEELRSRLQRGEIGHDHRLVDHSLAEELGVSRMPVREALLQLVSEGVLDSTSRGFALRRFSVDEIREVFEIRHLLEPSAAAMAARAVTSDALKRLGEICAEARKASDAGDVRTVIVSNAAFRDEWLSLVPNAHLRQEIVRFSDYVQAVRLATLQDKIYREDSVRRLDSILQAFSMRDEIRAAAAISAQLEGALGAFVAKLEQK
ncbi:GntR family transcriptional regulator [Ensifer sp. ENS05]|uniref:GntR family transcriptional regulator n=1 Tax=Ensifer sp. ENS05 TaxID=2769277 RepID=UPI00178370E0|nr:GntR family transcriptional regulator [Ensifer sp. ENS05]MBD9597398.1 GntR family transcriptional regulator [Ensifer sp. ENS05]